MIRSLANCVFAEWRLKLFWMLALNLCFYIPYPLLERHYFGQPHLISPCIVDRLIPFLPGSVWIYMSICLFMPLAPMLMTRRDELQRYGIVSLGMTAVAYDIYFFFPTTWIRPPHPTGTWLYDRIAATDLPLNEFPSLHAAYSVFTLLCLVRIFREMRAGKLLVMAATIWVVAILFTTLSTKQHAFADLVGGALLAWTAFRFSKIPMSGKIR